MDRWTTVGEAIADRLTKLGLGVTEAARQSGVDVQTWRAMMTAKRSSYQRKSIAGVCRTLGWTPDSIDNMLDGGPPTLAQQPDPEPPSAHLAARGVDLDSLDADELAALIARAAERLAGMKDRK